MPQNQFCHPLTRRFDWKKLKAVEHPYDVDQLNILSFPFIPTFPDFVNDSPTLTSAPSLIV